MRAIIIYYSYSGNTKKVADILTEYLRQRYEINPVRKRPLKEERLSNGVKILRLEALDESASFFKQATRAFFRKEAKISSVEFDLSSYDLICLGTPVWAFAPAPAMNAYLENCFGLKNKDAVLFTTYGSGAGAGRCLNYMQGILSKKGAKDFKKFSIQQFKVNDKEFVNKAISESLKL